MALFGSFGRRKPIEASPPIVLPDAPALYRKGRAHHQAGRLDEAETLYRQALGLDENHADSLHLLGVLHQQTAKPEEAIRFVRQAIAVSPDVSAYHSNLGNMLALSGQVDEAFACYGRAAVLSPGNAEAHISMGNIFRMKGQPDVAVRHYANAVKANPQLAQAHAAFGVALMDMGRIEEAEAALTSAYALDASLEDVRYRLQVILGVKATPEHAVAFFESALAMRPASLEALRNMGAALLRADRVADAIPYFRSALDAKPNDTGILRDLGIALIQEDAAEAEACFRKVLLSSPDDGAAWDGLGSAVHRRKAYGEALDCYRMAVRQAPGNAKYLMNLATALKMTGQSGEALECYRRAVAADPENAEIHFNMATLLLALGHFEEGWREYEWRWRRHRNARREFDRPRWQGEPGNGRTILLHCEQGLGDTIQFCRYASDVAARGFRVVLEVHPPLERLLQGLEGTDRVVALDSVLPPFDVWCPLLSVPGVLGLRLSDIAWKAPYVAVRQAVKEDARLRVGLVWAGNPNMKHDAERSVDIGLLSPLLEIPGITFVSLQKDGVIPQGYPLEDAMKDVADFVDTAAIVADLDIVVSVDTSVAHLAGAMGKPVLLLDRFNGCWRWLEGRDDSPWYPSVRIFRQPRPGDWETVVSGVADVLSGMAAERSLP